MQHNAAQNSSHSSVPTGLQHLSLLRGLRSMLCGLLLKGQEWALILLTAQAGEGWAMMLLNCPPLALSLFSPPAPLSFSGVGFSLG